MSRKSPTWVAILVTGILTAAIAAGATYALTRTQMRDLRKELDRGSSALADANARISSLETSLAAALETPEPETSTPPAKPETKTPEAPKPARQFAFVTKVAAGGSPSIKADYATFLTGEAAAKAAKARGDESPPPNDYYIVNDTRALETLKVSSDVKVHLVSNPDGTSDPAGYDSDYETWSNFFAAPSDENAGIRGAGYWLTIEKGVVTAIEEQFLP